MNSIPDREKRRQSLQCRLYGLPRAYPRMQGEGMLGRTISCSDVTRAFLQTEDLKRDIYVVPPIEAKIHASKCWKLKRAAYGLIDASRGFFLNYSKKLQGLG